MKVGEFRPRVTDHPVEITGPVGQVDGVRCAEHVVHEEFEFGRPGRDRARNRWMKLRAGSTTAPETERRGQASVGQTDPDQPARNSWSHFTATVHRSPSSVCGHRAPSDVRGSGPANDDDHVRSRAMSRGPRLSPVGTGQFPGVTRQGTATAPGRDGSLLADLPVDIAGCLLTSQGCLLTSQGG